MPKFVYVFTNEAQQELRSKGYICLGEFDTHSGTVYIFENKDGMCFDSHRHVFSNTLPI